MRFFQNKIESLKAKNRYRSLILASGIDLSSNDYLGFKDHPALKAAAIEAIENGVALGAGGSRLLRGNTPEHIALEEYVAAHYGFEKALYFANGFIANYALLTTIPTRHDVVLFDSLAHASMRDGLHASPAKSYKIPHNDVNAFEDALKKYRDQATQIYIAVESLYSMDGDCAPLAELYALALNYDAILIVDEAHSTGVYGAGGCGLVDEVLGSRSAPARLSGDECSAPARLREKKQSTLSSRDNLIVLHTCGKALGSAGGILCASADVIDYMINAARPFIFSTAPPPLQAYITMKAIELCAGIEGDQAREKLRRLCKMTQGKIGGYGSQIVPIILGDDEAAVKAAQEYQDKGYDIRAIRPPTVPEGTARLRLSLNAALDERDLRLLLDDIYHNLISKVA